MMHHEWQSCVDTLCENWKRYAEQFSNARWRTRFSHLNKAVFLRAIEAYADANLQAPTVDGLIPYLPKGTRVNKPAAEHVHLWEQVADAILCNLCGKHGTGCHCASCACPHRRTVIDGYADEQTAWMRCLECAGYWKRGGVQRPPQPPVSATMADADRVWGTQHARWVSQALHGTLTPTAQIIGYDDLARDYPELAESSKRAIVALIADTYAHSPDGPPSVPGFSTLREIDPFEALHEGT